MLTLTMLLAAILMGALAWFAVLGIAHHRRTNRLAVNAHRAGLQFSMGDPFGVPLRYADFALVASGHSSRASSVTFGRLGQSAIRSFDLHYELGHGTQRATRHLRGVAIETPYDLPPLQLWHDSFPGPLPLSAASSATADGPWRHAGLPEFATAVLAVLPGIGAPVYTCQAQGGTILLFLPLSAPVIPPDVLTQLASAAEQFDRGVENAPRD